VRSFFISLFCAACFSAGSQNLDFRILHSLNSGRHPLLDKIMQDVSFSVYVLEPIPPIGISLHGYFGKNKERLYDGYKSAISLCTALAISTGLKYSIGRNRPYNQYPDDIEPLDRASTPSFPSGHTTAAFATATAISLTYKKWYVTVPAFLYAATAGYSRMRLGMHYPSDVAGGMLLGSGSALLTWWLAKRIASKKEKPLPPGVNE
jgi:membrane-associated phospholipid phosphatase